MQKKKSIVAYCRAASVAQRGPSPIDRQKTALQRFAKRGAVEIRRFYCDEGISGLTLKRAGLRKLLRDCRRGRIATVIIESPDRLARNAELYSAVLRRLRASGVQLVVENERNSSVLGG